MNATIQVLSSTHYRIRRGATDVEIWRTDEGLGFRGVCEPPEFELVKRMFTQLEGAR